jgi:hypothetical protein
LHHHRIEDEIVTPKIALLERGECGVMLSRRLRLLKAGWHDVMMLGREERVAEGS